MIERVLITGGAGFIGSHVVDLLRAENLPVRVMDSLVSGSRENLSADTELVVEDIRTISALEKAMDGVSHVVHLAAQVSVPLSVSDPEHTENVNVSGTRNVLNVARGKGVQRVVLASSAAIYGGDPELPKREDMQPNPLSPYAASKVENEKDAERMSNEGLPTTALRFFNVYGLRQKGDHPYASVVPRFKEVIEAEETVKIFGDGSQTRDFVHVRDVARSILLALRASPEVLGTYNIGSGEVISINELLAHIESRLSRSVEREFLPERPGDLKHSAADISKARRELSYEPTTSIDEGLAELFS